MRRSQGEALVPRLWLLPDAGSARGEYSFANLGRLPANPRRTDSFGTRKIMELSGEETILTWSRVVQ